MAETKKRGFGDLINLTSDAFNASTAEKEQREEDQTPKMLSNRQSVYRVPLSMIKPDRFQARFLLPFELREAFFRQEIDWEETVRKWMALAEQDRLVRREIEELIALGDSLHDTGQIKPITGQVINEDGREVFKMLTGERRFWATAFQSVLSGRKDEPYVLAIIDNQPSLEKQIAENMAYKALTPVGKARAAARIVLESNGIQPNESLDEYSYFRQVLDVRLSDETKDMLLKTLQLERTYYGRLMKFFELPQDLLEICDRAEMPERVLREIMQYDAKFWPAAVRYYAEHDGRTYQDVHAFLERISGREKTRKVRLPADPATKSARSLKRVFLNLDELPQEDKLGSIADALVSEVAPEDARRMVGQMEQLTEALKVRVNNLK
ncbi:MAG TPA: hypothetical protein PK982_03370 [Anaerolineaceae bacterium]|jgi:hypothetical protein|nr:hypothetical protein [Anaerolineaceae bacterium]